VEVLQMRTVTPPPTGLAPLLVAFVAGAGTWAGTSLIAYAVLGSTAVVVVAAVVLALAVVAVALTGAAMALAVTPPRQPSLSSWPRVQTSPGRKPAP
jgi:hypothetical protein